MSKHRAPSAYRTIEHSKLAAAWAVAGRKITRPSYVDSPGWRKAWSDWATENGSVRMDHRHSSPLDTQPVEPLLSMPARGARSPHWFDHYNTAQTPQDSRGWIRRHLGAGTGTWAWKVGVAASVAALAVLLAWIVLSFGQPVEGHGHRAVTRSMSPQQVASQLGSHGYTTAHLKPLNNDNFLQDIGGSVWSLDITESGKTQNVWIDEFPTPADLQDWLPVNAQFGGVAVTGWDWAVSLPTDTDAQRAYSSQSAPAVARALGGTVSE